MPKRQLFLAEVSQAPGTSAGDTQILENNTASVFDQTGLAALFSTIAPPTALTGAPIAGGALVLNTTYKFYATSVGPLGESLNNTTELSQALGATGGGETLTVTQMAGAVGYRIYRTLTAGAANNETLVAYVPRPGNVVNTSTFTVTDLGTFPVTNVIIPTIDTTTAPAASGAPPSAITGMTGATLAGSTLPLLSVWQYKYTVVNALGESTASPASASITLTGTQNKVGGITLTAVGGAQYYNIYRAQVKAAVVGNFTYLCTVNANNTAGNQVLTTFVDDGNYKGSTAQPPSADGTGGASPQPVGKVFVSPYFSTFAPAGASFHPNMINGQQVLGLAYGINLAPAGTTAAQGEICQSGVVSALVNTAANYTGALTGGTLGTTVMGPLANTVIPGTLLQMDGAGYLCPVGFTGNANVAGQVNAGTLPGQVCAVALGTVGINQIQPINVLLGTAF